MGIETLSPVRTAAPNLPVATRAPMGIETSRIKVNWVSVKLQLAPLWGLKHLFNGCFNLRGELQLAPLWGLKPSCTTGYNALYRVATRAPMGIETLNFAHTVPHPKCCN